MQSTGRQDEWVLLILKKYVLFFFLFFLLQLFQNIAYFWYSDINRATLGMMLKWTWWQSAPLLYQVLQWGGRERERETETERKGERGVWRWVKRERERRMKWGRRGTEGALGWVEWKICEDREQYGRRWLGKMDRKRWEAEKKKGGGGGGGDLKAAREGRERNTAKSSERGERELRSGRQE